MTPPKQKQDLRQQLFCQRLGLSSAQLESHGEAIAQHLKRCDWFQSAQTVFAYRNFRQEVSLNSLFSTTHKVWGFPRCVGKQMRWHQWSGQKASEFVTSAYGIEEPDESWPTLETADLILVPTVACDRDGYRLGYGGGYYDRMLSQVVVRTIGIVLEDFLFEQLPRDDWDRPLKAVCTEAGFFKLNDI